MAAWNGLFVLVGLLLITLAGEAYFRLTRPFIETSIPIHFVDGVGLIREPNAELRYANWDDDNFVVSRVNSQGFLDREPVSAERAAAGCHIAFIGDSFVEAMEVPISDKFHVRLEDMAARELPHLGITTQAYGITYTGQINQISFYDEYASRLNPELVILVFFFNDFSDNSFAVQALGYGADPDFLPFMSAQRDESGALNLRPPDPEYERFMLPSRPQRWYSRAWGRLVQVSYFAKWLSTKSLMWVDDPRILGEEWTEVWADMIAERPCCAWMQDVWKPGRKLASIRNSFAEDYLPPALLEEGLEYTVFGVEQFERRADRDGVNLVILSATADMGRQGDPQFDRLSAIAEPRGIPVISGYDYIVRQGYDYRDGRWRNDIHWNAVGHRWAAEAVLEWLKANQDVCD